MTFIVIELGLLWVKTRLACMSPLESYKYVGPIFQRWWGNEFLASLKCKTQSFVRSAALLTKTEADYWTENGFSPWWVASLYNMVKSMEGWLMLLQGESDLTTHPFCLFEHRWPTSCWQPLMSTVSNATFQSLITGRFQTSKEKRQILASIGVPTKPGSIQLAGLAGLASTLQISVGVRALFQGCC